MRLGIDLGGSKIEGVVMDDQDRVLARQRVATPQGNYDGTITAVADLVNTLESHLKTEGLSTGRCSVGIGMPGALSTVTGLVKNANSTCLIGKPLQQDLEHLLDRPLRIANDANCFALSEASDGSARGAACVFGVILGTGVGGGVVVHGRPLTGANAICGEWGHNPLPWPDDRERPGPPCYCGKSGCIETFLSGPGLARDHHANVPGASADALDVPAIVAAAAAGDATAQASLDRYEERLAKALAHVINIIDPDVIVLGGGLSNLERLYDTLPKRLGAWVFSDHVTTRIRPPAHGDSSGVRGAAWLWGNDELATAQGT